MRRSARNNSDYERFVSLLIEARGEANLSQSELAARLHRPQSFVSKYESAERRVDFAEAVEILRAIGADPVAFMRRFAAGK